VTASTVRAALDKVFEDNPAARGYVLDEQGAVRRHVVIFVNGEPIRDREHQCDAVADGDEVFIFQALSGG
jgi:sulfur carrier protein ThiS